jgi:zinc transport system substrate-binding protein
MTSWLRRPRLITTVLAGGLALTACGGSGPGQPSTGDAPQVVASFYPLAFVAERVAGDLATVDNLTEPGVESHDLELTGRQVGAVSDADIVIYLAGFQPAVDDVVDENTDGSGLDIAEVVATTSDDPHVWLDPTAMVTITEAVAERLGELDAGNAEAYKENAAALVTELRALDDEFTAGLANCERTTIVVSHEAYGHLTERYGLQQVGISGLDPDSEPSAERMAEVSDVVESQGITTIFYERLVSPKVAETLAADLGVEAAVLDPIEGLTAETADEDYLTLMRSNLEVLRAANGCA